MIKYAIPPFVAPDWFNIRDYQEEAIKAIFAAFKSKESALLCLPTGTGKTKTFVELIRRVYAKNHNRKFLVLVPFDELRTQTRLDCMAFGLSDDQVVVETNSYFYRHYLEYKKDSFFIVIQDEAHHSAADSNNVVLNYFSTPYKLGCSATPERLDGLPLIDIFHTLVQPYPVQWYEDNGYLAEVDILSVDLADIKLKGGDDNLSYQGSLLDTPTITGDVIEHYREYLYKVPTIGFCTSIQHSQNVCDKFNESFGDNWAVHLDNKTPKKKRRDALQAFKDGEIKYLGNVQLFVEGVDIPSAKGCIFLRKTASPIIWNQAIGRIRRPNGVKGICLDHVGNETLHGHPNFNRLYTLKGKDKKRKDYDSTNLIPVEIPTNCPKCNAEFIDFGKDLRCLVCGTNWKKPTNRKDSDAIGFREPEQIDGKLVLRKTHPGSTNIAKLISTWKATQTTDKPYKPGWMMFRIKDLKSTFPDLPDELSMLAFKSVGYLDRTAMYMIDQINKELGITNENV